MTRIDSLKKKAIRAMPVKDHSRAVAAYFDMVRFIYNDGRQSIDEPMQALPGSDTQEFWDLFELLHLDCTREEMRAWMDRPAVEDHRPKSEGVLKLEACLAKRAADKGE